MSWKDIEKSNSGEKGDKTSYTKFEEGSTLIRILGEEPFSFWSHYMTNQKTSVTCPGKGCPICKVIEASKKTGEKTNKYNTSRRHAITIWNYETERQEIMISSKTLFGQLLEFLIDEELGDLREYDVKIIRRGKGTETTYSVLPGKRYKFEHDDECEEIDIENILKAPTHEQIKLLMEGKTWDEINEMESNNEDSENEDIQF